MVTNTTRRMHTQRVLDLVYALHVLWVLYILLSYSSSMYFVSFRILEIGARVDREAPQLLHVVGVANRLKWLR
jgi:hypothetical protein